MALQVELIIFWCQRILDASHLSIGGLQLEDTVCDTTAIPTPLELDETGEQTVRYTYRVLWEVR
jgi:hypothetical protein